MPSDESRERYAKLKRVFNAACKVDPDARPALLDRECGDDADLRARVEALLERDDRTVTSPARDAPPTRGAPHPAPLPDRIGDYSIRSVIASGGMGTVYLAQQEHPRRAVALKVMQRGIASRSALRRFEYESQILARLRHPNIAQVYESGTHDDGGGGVPFFAMEYVPNAKAITEYAEQSKLGTRDRLLLFGKVCDAVHHGHTKGIIHRDLKPGNILVDSSGEPKVIDFGVARATDSDLAVTTVQTDIGQLIGTLQYMSPEQCDADPHDLDTRSDVYALGVVLYELLCGRLPYDITKAAIHEAARVIREEPPAKPSTVDRTLRGDVETIALKALEKDRNRRYRSAEALGEDIRRYLGNEPIQARPPSLRYHLTTFARRHTALVAGVAAVFVVLVGGIVSTGVALGRVENARSDAVAAQRAEARQKHLALQREREAIAARQEAEDNEERARTEQVKAEQIATFTTEMLSGIDPRKAGDLDKTLMRMVLDGAAARIGTDLADQPEIQASVRLTIGRSYLAIGEYDHAEPHLELSCDLRRTVLGEEHPDTLNSMNTLAGNYLRQGRYDQAEPLDLETLETRRRVLGAEHPDTLTSMNNLAVLYQVQGRYDEAEPLLRRALETRRRVLGDEHQETLRSTNSLAALYARQGRVDEAEPLYLRTLETQRRVLGDEHPDTLQSMDNLALLYSGQGRYDEAEQFYERTLEAKRRVLGDEHPDTLLCMHNLAGLYRRQGLYDKAETLYLKTLETRRRVLGDEHPSTLSTLCNLAIVYENQGRYAEAEPLYLKTLEVWKRDLGIEHQSTLGLMCNLASAYKSQGRHDEAERLYLRTLEVMRRVLGEEHQFTLNVMGNLGVLYKAQGRYDEAEPVYSEVLAIWRRVHGDEHPGTLSSMHKIANLYRDQGRHDDAEPLYLQLVEIQGRVLGGEHPRTLSSTDDLAVLYERQGRFDEAEPIFERVLGAVRRVLGDEHPETLITMNDLARLLLTATPTDRRDPARALALSAEANEAAGHENPEHLGTLSLAYHLTGDTAKAVENQRKAIALLPPGESDLRTSLEAALAEFEAALAERGMDDGQAEVEDTDSTTSVRREP